MNPPQTLIFDLSSDEEVGFDSSSSADNFDWITKLLEDVDSPDEFNPKVADFSDNLGKIMSKNGEDNDEDDDDDVVVVGEVIAKPKRAKRSFYKSGGYNGGGDDDCVVLEGDPDKLPASEVKGAEKDVEEDDDEDGDDDDLVVVGEKGQVACRDFPHSRHLCANFPFSSTPHESRCDLCHCYVCDSLAPCPFWGSGASTADHCHATDKTEYWQLERKKVRVLKNPPVPSTKPAVSRAQHSHPLPIYVRNPVPRQASACGVSSSLAAPNIISQGRSQSPSIAVARSRLQPCSVSRQLLRTINCNTQGNRTGCVAPRMVASRPMFKRPGYISRSGVANRSALYPPNNLTAAHVQMPNYQSARKPIENNAAHLRVPSPVLDINLTSCQPNTSTLSPGTLTSRLHRYSLSSPHTPTSQFQGRSQSAAVMSDSPYVYSSVNQAQSVSGPVLPCNTSNGLNSLPQSSQHLSAVADKISGPNFTSCSSNVLSSITQMSSQPSVATENFSTPIYPCSPSNDLNSVAQNGPQPLADSALVQEAAHVHELLPSVEQNPLPFGGTNCSSLDFDIDSWFQDDESYRSAPEGSYYDMMMNSQPSLTAPVDAAEG